ncbi:hypothetical protein K1T71_004545 [Dendrolimus kikuchii]|uniref:Uncharacterized protein n=1 Tax=Dendrolimus kikuchii TaxID=765133 RepID=A0ACC1D7R0_9NEOP|nr:hypothetical protein K1T71_004545 [Dendrolimus kikuchii]
MDLFFGLSIRLKFSLYKGGLSTVTISARGEAVNKSTNMVFRPVVIVAACYGVFIIVQSLIPKAMALKKTSNLDQYMVEDRRSHKRQNYFLQKARENEFLGNNNDIGVPYEIEPFSLEPSPEELSAFIVDYANMFRNDVILLDNSVETRTSKKGNIKVKKYNQAIDDPPCTCNYSKSIKDLGESAFPRFVETRNCNQIQKTCVLPNVCRESLYNLTIIRRRESIKRSRPDSDNPIPDDLRYRWTREYQPVSVGCICMRDYSDKD